MEEEFENRFWRPHFIIGYDKEHELYKVTLHEVHYENNVPVTWTANPVDVSAFEEDAAETISQAKGLLDIYATASSNCVYKIYTYKDDNGEEHERLEEVLAHNYNITSHDGELNFDLSSDDEESSTIQVNLDHKTLEKLESLGADLDTEEGLNKLYEILGDVVENRLKDDI